MVNKESLHIFKISQIPKPKKLKQTKRLVSLKVGYGVLFFCVLVVVLLRVRGSIAHTCLHPSRLFELLAHSWMEVYANLSPKTTEQ